jgi:hypothetical protein
MYPYNGEKGGVDLLLTLVPFSVPSLRPVKKVTAICRERLGWYDSFDRVFSMCSVMTSSQGSSEPSCVLLQVPRTP